MFRLKEIRLFERNYTVCNMV